MSKTSNQKECTVYSTTAVEETYEVKPVFDRKKGLGHNRNFLTGLRQQGIVRRKGNKHSHCLWLIRGRLGMYEPSGVFLDAGCGESPDADIALGWGFDKAYGMDLYDIKSETKSEFIKGDICKHIPLEDNSVDVITSHWVLSLLSKKDRTLFYKEAYRVLKPEGYLVYFGGELSSGIGRDFTVAREKNRLKECGFKYIETSIAQK